MYNVFESQISELGVVQHIKILIYSVFMLIVVMFFKNKIQSNLDISNSDISNFAKLEVSI